VHGTGHVATAGSSITSPAGRVILSCEVSSGIARLKPSWNRPDFKSIGSSNLF